MAEVFGNIDYERLKRAFGRANVVEKVEIDLATAHALFANASLIASGGLRVKVLNKGTGTFTLTFVFTNGDTLSLEETELSNGDELDFDFFYLYIYNTAQIGKTLTLLVYYRLITGVMGY